MSLAFVFPGQGSQAVGMGRDLADAFPVARLTFEEIDDALSQRLSKLMFEGPAEDLNLTENTQPALMAVSLAVFRVLTDLGMKPLPLVAQFVAGHSLGEYSALAAAGAFTVICGEAPQMDAHPEWPGDNVGYAAFGQVIEGMEVVRAILALPTGGPALNPEMAGEMLNPPVAILAARRM